MKANAVGQLPPFFTPLDMPATVYVVLIKSEVRSKVGRTPSNADDVDTVNVVPNASGR